ncbi:MAG: glycosyltransferase family 4 protein [Hyphomicrobiales bacterium]|nr:glycosyltransferase family 4 protein [Hyphomicrobiales bacterium]MCP5370511.1 glycosyltransferase family 4 protein [Hyphomicrobiales bacterium]
MNWLIAAAVCAVCAVATGLATAIVLPFLRARRILDHPNDRSSHAAPKPRGGGIAVTGVLVLAWAAVGVLDGAEMAEVLAVCALAGVLAAVSWIDDLRGLSPALRLAVQAACVGLALVAGAPWAPAPILAALGLIWIWFVNLYNFMDGIDAITGVETLAIGLGAAVVAAVAGLGDGMVLLGVTAAGAALGFLYWNWPPSKLFLGDVGSVPLGFLLGWLLLKLVAAGLWAPALILPLYYLADATLTLGRRTARGRKPWVAHRDHFYQRAEQAGRSHAAVSATVGAVNAVLAALAIIAVYHPGPALAVAAAVVAALLWHFGRPASHGAGTRP